ncbi:MAG: Rrf2 family transcriptional regulator [Sandaracinaceae bacterium]|nr:Rrf2 family transcriptional regulator [Sandaracinaceae bacterium]
MHLQQRTDYAIRLLIHLAVDRSGPRPVGDIARGFDISEHHLAKVAQRLRELGYLSTIRGRNGGFELALDPASIRLGDLVRQLEEMTIVECFDRAQNRCAITGACLLRGVLERARASFLAVLDEHTLEDLVGPRRADLAQVLDIRPR